MQSKAQSDMDQVVQALLDLWLCAGASMFFLTAGQALMLGIVGSLGIGFVALGTYLFLKDLHFD